MATKKATKATPAPAPEEAKLATINKSNALSKTDFNKMLLADEGAGQENIGAQDMAIPRVSILQKGSPQCDKADGAFLKGAEQGDFYDSVANAVYAKGDKGFLFIPVSYRRANIEWIPRKQGGGFVKDHGNNDAILQQCTQDADTKAMVLKNGHEIVTCAEYFCICTDPNGKNPRQAVLSFAKTQFKKAKKLNTQLTQLMVPRPDGNGVFNPAMFYSAFTATTVPESNEKGSWMGWDVTRQGDTLELPGGQDLYLAARQFRKAVAEGTVKVAAPVVESGSSEPSNDNEAF